MGGVKEISFWSEQCFLLKALNAQIVYNFYNVSPPTMHVFVID